MRCQNRQLMKSINFLNFPGIQYLLTLWFLNLHNAHLQVVIKDNVRSLSRITTGAILKDCKMTSTAALQVQVLVAGGLQRRQAGTAFAELLSAMEALPEALIFLCQRHFCIGKVDRQRTRQFVCCYSEFQATIIRKRKSIRKVFRLLQKKLTRRKPRCIDRRFLSQWSSVQVRSSRESLFLSARTKREENDGSAEATLATIKFERAKPARKRK